MSIIFLTDLGISFNVAFLEDGDWVTDRGRIARHYLSGWFCVDAPSSMPIELIELVLDELEPAPTILDAVGASKKPKHAGGAELALPAFRIFRLLRLVRMLRLLKVRSYMTRVEENE